MENQDAIIERLQKLEERIIRAEIEIKDLNLEKTVVDESFKSIVARLTKAENRVTKAENREDAHEHLMVEREDRIDARLIVLEAALGLVESEQMSGDFRMLPTGFISVYVTGFGGKFVQWVLPSVAAEMSLKNRQIVGTLKWAEIQRRHILEVEKEATALGFQGVVDQLRREENER